MHAARNDAPLFRSVETGLRKREDRPTMVSMERDRLKRRTVFDRVPNGGDVQKDTSVRVFV